MESVLPDLGRLLELAGQARLQLAAAVDQADGTAPLDTQSFMQLLLDSLAAGSVPDTLPGPAPSFVQLVQSLSPALQAENPCPALLAIGHIQQQQSIPASSGGNKTGTVYTPYGLAQSMARELLADWQPQEAAPAQPGDLPRLLDPACGSGAFLLCAAQELYDRLSGSADSSTGTADATERQALRIAILRQALHGCDTDPGAIALCGQLLSFWATGSFSELTTGLRLVHADALSGADLQGNPGFATQPPGLDWQADPLLGLHPGGYQYIIGNPPYVDSEGMSRNRSEYRRQIRRSYDTARGNWDLFIPFLERGLDLLAAGGRLSMVVPARSLCSGYAAAIQARLLAQRIERIQLLGPDTFTGASVWTAVLQVQAAAVDNDHLVSLRQSRPEATGRLPQVLLRSLPAGYLAAAFSPAARSIVSLLDSSRPLGDVLSCGDGCSTAEAYQISELLLDTEAAADGFRLLNTGTLDPFCSLWGIRPCRYLGHSYQHPTLDRRQLGELLPRRAKQATNPKVLCAGLSARLECFADRAGEYLCGKAAVQLIAGEGGPEPDFICGLLNSSLLNWLYRSLFGLRAYNSRALNIGPRQLELLPYREGDQAIEIAKLSRELHAQAADGRGVVLNSQEMQRIDELVLEMYGVDDGLRTLIESEIR